MNNKKMLRLMGAALFTVVLFSIWSFENTKPIGASGNADLSTDASALPTDQGTTAAKAKPEKLSVYGPLSHTEQEEPIPEEFMTAAIQSQMADIARAYQENARFPSYSKPLKASDWNLLNPRPFVSKEVPLDLDENLSARIWIEHYIVHAEYDLPVEVQVSGLSASTGPADSVTVYLSNGRELSASTRLSPVSKETSSNSQSYVGYLPSKLLQSHLSSTTERQEEVQLIARIAFSGDRSAQVGSIFKLVLTDALLTDLSPSRVDGEHMIIPATFDVSVPGYYRMQANLFDKQSGAPISHINTAFMLSEQDNMAEFKVHAVTLRAMGFDGPYVLKDFNLSRGPARPGDLSGYGLSLNDHFEVNGHDLSLYEDTEYVDPATQQRLEFLHRMAGTQH